MFFFFLSLFVLSFIFLLFFFFFNDTATTEIYTLSLHDALPILPAGSTAIGCGDSAASAALRLGTGFAGTLPAALGCPNPTRAATAAAARTVPSTPISAATRNPRLSGRCVSVMTSRMPSVLGYRNSARCGNTAGVLMPFSARPKAEVTPNREYPSLNKRGANPQNGSSGLSKPVAHLLWRGQIKKGVL